MVAHLISFADAVAANPGTGDYATKAAPVAADILYIGDSADVNRIKRVPASAFLSAADSQIMNADLTNTSGTAKVHNAGNQNFEISSALNMTYSANTTMTLNSTTHQINSDSVIINGSTAGVVGSITMQDGDDTNSVSLAVPTDVTTTYTATLPAAPPIATSVMTMTTGGQVGFADLHERPYRGLFDASTNTFPTSATAGLRAGDAIQAGDYFPVEVAGTLGTQAVAPGDVLYAEVDMTDPQTATATNWTIVRGAANASNDTHLMSENRANTAGTAILHDSANQDWGIDNINNLAITAVTGQSTNAAGGVWGWNAARTVSLGGYTTGNKLEGVVGAATQWLGTTATGDVVQVPVPSAVTDTNNHIFDDTLPAQAANVGHDQATFNVTFSQTGATAGMQWSNGVTNGFGIKQGVARMIGANGNWWDLAIGALGQLVTTDTGTAAF